MWIVDAELRGDITWEGFLKSPTYPYYTKITKIPFHIDVQSLTHFQYLDRRLLALFIHILSLISKTSTFIHKCSVRKNHVTWPLLVCYLSLTCLPAKFCGQTDASYKLKAAEKFSMLRLANRVLEKEREGEYQDSEHKSQAN